MGCPGQLTRTTTIPHGPLDILQAQEQVRHRGGDRRAHRGSNPGRERKKSHDWPQQLDPQVQTHDSISLEIGWETHAYQSLNCRPHNSYSQKYAHVLESSSFIYLFVFPWKFSFYNLGVMGWDHKKERIRRSKMDF